MMPFLGVPEGILSVSWHSRGAGRRLTAMLRYSRLRSPTASALGSYGEPGGSHPFNFMAKQKAPSSDDAFCFGVPEGIRTPDRRLRRPLLYPTELRAQNGAGEGNRTLTISLEG